MSIAAIVCAWRCWVSLGSCPRTSIVYIRVTLCMFCGVAIEKLWWSSKSWFNKRMLASSQELTVEKFHQLILESVNSVPTQKVLNMCSSNRKFIA